MEGMVPFILGLVHNVQQVNPASSLVLRFLLELEGAECVPLFLTSVLQWHSLHILRRAYKCWGLLWSGVIL